MTSAPMVTVSTSVSTHEDAHKCIEAVQRIFPDFQPEGEFSIEKFPIQRDSVQISQEGVAPDLFLQLLSEQRILDTALDAMSLNLNYGTREHDSEFITSFLK